MVVGVCGLKRTMRVSGGRAVKGQVAAHPNRAGPMLRKPKKCTKLGRQRGQAEHTHFFLPAGACFYRVAFGFLGFTLFVLG